MEYKVTEKLAGLLGLEGNGYELKSGWWSVPSGVPRLSVLGWGAFNTFISAPGDGMAGTSVGDAKMRGVWSVLERRLPFREM